MRFTKKTLMSGCVLAAVLGFVTGLPIGYTLYHSGAVAAVKVAP